MAELRGPLQDRDRAALAEYITRQFDTLALERLLRARLRLELREITAQRTIAAASTELVAAACEGCYDRELARAVLSAGRPEEGSREFFDRLGICSESALEGMLARGATMVDVAFLGQLLQSAEARVFSMQLDGRHLGTGSLVGPDLGLTNLHVLRPALDVDGRPKAEIGPRLSAVFDMSLDPSVPGQRFGLASVWLVASSPSHGSDSSDAEHDCTPLLNALDFALVRLDRCVGCLPYSRTGRARGWYQVRPDAVEPRIGEQLFIVQHASGRPKTFCQGQVTWFNENRSRMRYDLQTLPGSSGAPCIGSGLDLVAIHCSTQPIQLPPTYNQGIPARAIASELDSLGLLGILPAPPLAANSHGFGGMPGLDPVLGRSTVVAALHQLLLGTGPHVMLVDGLPGSGRQFIRRIAEHVAGFDGVACASSGESWIAASEATDLLKLLAHQLALDLSGWPEREPGQHSSKWHAFVLSWLIGQLDAVWRARRCAVLLVLDFVADGGPTQDLRDLLSVLIERAGSMPGVRMVLIGTENALSAAARGCAFAVQVKPVVPSDISSYLLGMSARNSQTLTVAEADMIADRLFATLPMSGPQRWEELRRRASVLGEAMERSA